MAEPMKPLRIEEAPRRLVAQQRIILEAVPQPLHHLDEFGGALVALRVAVVLVEAEVVRLVLGGRGDDVPAGAAVAQ